MFLGLHYDRSDDTTAARAQYETAYDLAPRNPAICVEIGQTWVAEGRYVAAEIWLREAVLLRPSDPGLWVILARFYLDHNIASKDRAIEATDTLLTLAPDDAVAHDLRAWAALQVGDYETVEEHLRRSMELDSQLASAHYHLGLLRSDQGRRSEAEEAFTRAIDLDTTGEFVLLVERASVDHE
jgi:Flp pilus assembly protein TadD